MLSKLKISTMNTICSQFAIKIYYIDLLKIVKLQFSFEKQTTAFIYFAFVDERLDSHSDHARVLLPIRD